MDSNIPQAVTELVVDSVRQMVATMDACSDFKLLRAGVSVREAAETEMAAVLGYTGEVARGSLAVTAARVVIDKSHPNHKIGMPVGDDELVDWIGEIANQTLGRIKNQLAARGVAFVMATPTTVLGKSIQVRAPKDGFALEVVFGGSLGALAVHFLSELSPGVDLSAPSKAVTEEGGGILF